MTITCFRSELSDTRCQLGVVDSYLETQSTEQFAAERQTNWIWATLEKDPTPWIFGLACRLLPLTPFCVIAAFDKYYLPFVNRLPMANCAAVLHTPGKDGCRCWTRMSVWIIPHSHFSFRSLRLLFWTRRYPRVSVSWFLCCYCCIWNRISGFSAYTRQTKHWSLCMFPQTDST